MNDVTIPDDAAQSDMDTNTADPDTIASSDTDVAQDIATADVEDDVNPPRDQGIGGETSDANSNDGDGTSPKDEEAQVDRIRQLARRLIHSYVPSDTGDEKFSQIAKDYTGGGTTCGFLCHWLLWRIGCTDTNILNRNEPGFQYKDAQNISRLFNGGKEPFVQVFGTSLMQKGVQPDLGDIIFIKEAGPAGPTKSEHVFVLDEKVERDGKIIWKTAESGQTNPNGMQCARLKERELKLGATKDALVSGNSPERNVIGWISLAKLKCSVKPPVDDDPLLDPE